MPNPASSKKDLPQAIEGMNFLKIFRQNPGCGYLLYGEEDYLKNHTVEEIRKEICPDEILASFNDIRLDSLSYSADALIHSLEPLPMMGDKKIITVSGVTPGTMKAEEVDALLDALSMLPEYDYNVVLFCVPNGGMEKDDYNKKTELLTKLSRVLTPVVFSKTPLPKLKPWVARHFQHLGVKAGEEICTYLIERSGTDMYVLANEIEKVSYFVLAKGCDTVSVPDVDCATARNTDYDTFEFSNALLQGNSAGALRILEEKKNRREEPVAVLSEIAGTVSDMMLVGSLTGEGLNTDEIAKALGVKYGKVAIYQKALRGQTGERLQRLLQLCRDADEALKQFSGDGFQQLEQLLCAF